MELSPWKKEGSGSVANYNGSLSWKPESIRSERIRNQIGNVGGWFTKIIMWKNSQISLNPYFRMLQWLPTTSGCLSYSPSASGSPSSPDHCGGTTWKATWSGTSSRYGQRDEEHPLGIGNMVGTISRYWRHTQEHGNMIRKNLQAF